MNILSWRSNNYYMITAAEQVVNIMHDRLEIEKQAYNSVKLCHTKLFCKQCSVKYEHNMLKQAIEVHVPRVVNESRSDRKTPNVMC